MTDKFVPEVGACCAYQEYSAGNWSLVKIIARYDDRIWIHNLNTGAMPVKREVRCTFKPADEMVAAILERGKKK